MIAQIQLLDIEEHEVAVQQIGQKRELMVKQSTFNNDSIGRWM